MKKNNNDESVTVAGSAQDKGGASNVANGNMQQSTDISQDKLTHTGNDGAATLKDTQKSTTKPFDISDVEGVKPKLNIPQPKQQKLSYVEMHRLLSPDKPISAEQLAKEKRRQRGATIFSAIGDGISALSNLFATAQGANNSYDARNSMSIATKNRYDKIKAEREDKKREYFNGYLRATQMDDSISRYDRDFGYRVNRDKVLDEGAEKDRDYRDKEYDRYGEWHKEGVKNDMKDKEYIRNRDEKWREEDSALKNKPPKAGDGGWKKQFSKKVPFYTKDGMIEVPEEVIKNPANLSYIFNMLPPKVRDSYREFTVDISGNRHYANSISDKNMLQAIGNNSENEEVREALKEMSGSKPAGKKLGLK